MHAINGVGEADLFAISAGHPEAKSEGLPGGGAAIAFGSRKFTHARVKEPGLIGARFFAVARVRWGEVAVCQSFLEDGIGDLAVQRQSFGLLILFVPAQIEPAQAVENRIDAGFGVALDVGIVEAEDHGPSMMAGIEPVEDEGAGAANVQKTGRRRSESDSKHNF